MKIYRKRDYLSENCSFSDALNEQLKKENENENNNTDTDYNVPPIQVSSNSFYF